MWISSHGDLRVESPNGRDEMVWIGVENGLRGLEHCAHLKGGWYRHEFNMVAGIIPCVDIRRAYSGPAKRESMSITRLHAQR